MASLVSVEAANAFMRDTFSGDGTRPEVVRMEPGEAVMRLQAGPHHLRPGDLISGPTQMSLADTVAYMVVFTRLGITPMTVTSSLNMSFLRGCRGSAVVAVGRLLKLGRTLAVIEVTITAEGAEAPASHAVVTYALPQGESA